MDAELGGSNFQSCYFPVTSLVSLFWLNLRKLATIVKDNSRSNLNSKILDESNNIK